MAKKVILYTDGAARGNPGRAAIGVCVTDARGREIEALGEAIGEATNNEAEYRALLRGLERAQALGAEQVQVRSDSDLMVAQIRGDYRVRAANLKPLIAEVHRAMARFPRISIEHIPRERNRRADRLANRALDRASPRQ